MAQMSREFLEDSQERIALMLEMYEFARAGNRDKTRNLAAFRRELHTMKGQGGSYGFPSISLIAHRFEEFLLDFSDADDWTVNGAQDYLDALEQIIHGGKEPTTKEVRALLRNLPSSITHPDSNITVVWVCSARVIRHKIRRDLEEFGFNVIAMNDPFDALRYICKTHPEFVVCSATLDGISGFDLIHILAGIQDTQHIPCVLVTSFDPNHAQLLSLPPHVPVVKLSPFLGDELAHALSSMEYKQANPAFNVRKD